LTNQTPSRCIKHLKRAMCYRYMLWGKSLWWKPWALWT
jgi:hypothetical protein